MTPALALHEHWVTAPDGLAIALGIILILAFATVLTLVFSIVRHSRQPENEVDLLLEELREAERASAGPAIAPGPPQPSPPAATLQPWEREGDWWKGTEPGRGK